jgi:hypothetical protein
VIVVISIANLALDATAISFDIPVFKLMRILRCFRALRMLTHVDRLRMVRLFLLLTFTSPCSKSPLSLCPF